MPEFGDHNGILKTYSFSGNNNQWRLGSGVSNKLISDIILIAYEIMHLLERKKKGKDKYLAMK